MEKHAFLIIAHNEPRVLQTLLRLLDDPRNDIYLLIDARARQLRERFAAWRQERGGFRLLESPPKIYWGDISQVEAEFRLFREARERGAYAYYHLLSGTDLPLRPMDALHEFFTARKGQEFVSFWNDRKNLRDLRRKVGRYHFFTRHLKDKGTLAHALTAPLRNISLAVQKALRLWRGDEGREFRKGSNWASLTDSFVEYLLSQEDWVLKRFKRTLCPDEIFLQTLLWNSGFKSRAYNYGKTESETSLRAIDWERGKPYVWQKEDIPCLLRSGALFARKFSERHFDAVEAVSGAESLPKG